MCGVIGILTPGQTEEENLAAKEAYRGLLTLQHRGQDAAGLLSYDYLRGRFSSHKQLGLIDKVFSPEILAQSLGQMCIAHTRYATMGSDQSEDLQPLVSGFPFGVGMIHNGNLLNYQSLAKKLNEEFRRKLLTTNDLEVLLALWCQFLNHLSGEREGREFHVEDAIKASDYLMDLANGAYATVGIVADHGMFGMRDPHGIRPLILGKKEGPTGTSYCLCSESIALNFIGYDYVRDIRPGEFIFISIKGEITSYVKEAPLKKPAPCMFEWIYFSAAESYFEDQSIYSTRLNLGKVLAEKVKEHFSTKERPDLISPVPDTSRTSSIAVAEELGWPYREALIKNRYIQRSFILNSQEKREKAVELKLSPVRSEIKDKHILLIDDSIVRGTTSKRIIDLLKRYGAKKVTMAITCPPIRYSCYYGIDFPREDELIAGGKDIQAIADYIGAEGLIYLTEEDVKRAIGIPDLCMACINKNYPTSVEEGHNFALIRQELRSPQ